MPLMKIYTIILASWCFGSGAITAIIAGKNWIENDGISSVPMILGILTFGLGFMFLVLALKVVFPIL